MSDTAGTTRADRAAREWRLVREEARDGAMAMALDEVAAETAAEGGPRTVRVYQWQPSTLSLGYRQAADTVDWEFCARRGIDVVRRPTGGGGIYHDTRGDISYSIIAPADELPGDLMETYELLCEPLFDWFERLGVDARFAERERAAAFEPSCYLRDIHPAHDVVAADGRKLSGNAQYRRRDAVIQHGSIQFETVPETHVGCFAGHDLATERFADRVTSLVEQATVGNANVGAAANGDGAVDDAAGERLDRAHAVRELEAALASWAGIDLGTDDGEGGTGGWTDAELARAEERADRKYRSDEWTRDRVDPMG